jgi:hypothetical protein
MLFSLPDPVVKTTGYLPLPLRGGRNMGNAHRPSGAESLKQIVTDHTSGGHYQNA